MSRAALGVLSVILLLWSGATPVLLGCTHGRREGEGQLGRGTVVLESGGRTVRVAVEVAREPEQRARGLMYRRELAPRHGMLFIFDEEQVQSFWMQNTYIPLDMIFINRKMEVVGIVENAEPMTTTSRRVDRVSIYVLEVKGGFCRAQGVTVGAGARFEGIPR